MDLKLRKFFIGLISLGAVLAAYLLYNQLSETPQIEIDRPAEFADIIADSNAEKFTDEIGMIGDVGVGTARVARFVDYNEDKTVKREFGFEKLLHEEGDEWEVEKPFMNVFRRSYKCYITADKGKVQVETVAGRPGPKDATLDGNVVVHILPAEASDIQESFIYFDNVDFVSEKSQFSTAGPVKFISHDAEMLGVGAELIYNGELDRLEFLRIIHLESLRLKTSEASPLSSDKTAVTSPAGADNKVKALLSPEPAAADIAQNEKPSSAKKAQPVEHAPTVEDPILQGDAVRKPAPTSPPVVARREEGQYYKCLFRRNVVIDTPEQLIFADEFFINKIFWSKTSSEKPTEPDVGGIDTKKVKSENEKGKTPDAEPDDTNTAGANSSPSPGAAAANHTKPKGLGEQFVNIVVTCDGGIVVVPVDSSIAHRSLAGSEAVATEKPGAKGLNDTTGRTIFVARRIDYDASTGNTVAAGPSELTFYANDVIGTDAKIAVPVKITAQKKARFLPALNRAIFEGDCLCTMLREDSGIWQKYTLSAPVLTVDLTKDTASDADIEHLTADGGSVKLATVKTAEGKLLGGIELKCRRFDFDTARQMFLATGPGVIKVDNSGVPGPNEKAGRFSLKEPCYVVVRDFDTLEYFLQSNRIIADAGRGGIFIDYFPVVEGQYGQQAAATAAHIDALLHETADGELEIATLSATDGITYEDQDKQFAGSELFYDHANSIITVRGNELQPCLLNGALVDGIEYDLRTGKVKTKISGPGALQMKR